MRDWLEALEGPQTLGRGRMFWGVLTAVVVLLAALPVAGDEFLAGNLAYLLLWTFMALGLSLLWGTTGVLSLGQTAYMGIAGYAYGVCSTHWGSEHGATFGSALLALLIVAAVAAVMGWVMFYGGVRDVFVGIVTLAFTLVLETFMSQTAGPEWTIAGVRLNGFNGMSGMPPLTLPWPGSENLPLDGNAFYWFVLAAGLIAYLGLRVLVNSRLGNVLVAIRDNPQRAEALGYDVRSFQLLVFVVAAVLAGMTGVLYTSWGTYITPSVMGLSASALPVIWVAAGGKRDLGATLLSTVGLIWLSQQLSIYGSQYALVIMGILLLAVVMLLPDGIVPGLVRLYRPRSTGGRP